ncbi:GGDEF domain-containing protein [Paenibacillus sp. CAA11]|uniref:GGDEF domain-containing protein n=1 Tax=Paenibacillus sp. CAA11 TaxID=1532905 RepID=UPI000D356119|nr:diguanylate cyclase [Paenibacillus sp. CAA11]AWB46459.1 GGDEF domain-containing protein [Paenibacillus sp. CAA11]
MRRNASLISDGALLLLFIWCFIAIVFMAGDQSQYIQNMIFLNVAFLIAIVTYFTQVTAGLILNILFIFGYGTYTLYQTVVVGDAMGTGNYFWLVMTPLLTFVTWLLTLGTKQLQEENGQLQRVNSSLATLDEHTNLKNNRLFQKDAATFMALSTRYQIPLTLLVIHVKYWDELKRMISAEQITAVIYDVSELSQTSIRSNDSLYMLGTPDHPTWGLLLFTERQGAEVVIERLREKMAELNTSDAARKYRVDLQLKIGAVEYSRELMPTPMDFMLQAKKQLEYDV